MAELKQKSLTDIGFFVPPTKKEVKEQWPTQVPLTNEIYERVVRLIEEKGGVSIQEAYRQIHEEDSQSDHPWSK